MEKLAGLRDFASHFGYKVGPLDGGRDVAFALNKLMADASEKPELGAIQILALRSMAKACYSVDNIGHYGLAFPFYTHFTSPIRRYPDMMVHRLLAKYLDGGESAPLDHYATECKHASEREVVAAEAERESIKYKLVEFMQDKIGQEFDGHVSGVTEWGLYVEIEPTKIEGMIPYRTIRSDFFDFDQDHYRAVGRRSRRSIRLGDPLRIRVKATSLEQKLLDYELVEDLPGRSQTPDSRTEGTETASTPAVFSDQDMLEEATQRPAPRSKRPARSASSRSGSTKGKSSTAKSKSSSTKSSSGPTKSKTGATKSKTKPTKSKTGTTKSRSSSTKSKTGATKSKAGSNKGKVE